jgi:hypothetical protein
MAPERQGVTDIYSVSAKTLTSQKYGCSNLSNVFDAIKML